MSVFRFLVFDLCMSVCMRVSDAKKTEGSIHPGSEINNVALTSTNSFGRIIRIITITTVSHSHTPLTTGINFEFAPFKA